MYFNHNKKDNAGTENMFFPVSRVSDREILDTFFLWIVHACGGLARVRAA